MEFVGQRLIGNAYTVRLIDRHLLGDCQMHRQMQNGLVFRSLRCSRAQALRGLGNHRRTQGVLIIQWRRWF